MGIVPSTCRTKKTFIVIQRYIKHKQVQHHACLGTNIFVFSKIIQIGQQQHLHLIVSGHPFAKPKTETVFQPFHQSLFCMRHVLLTVHAIGELGLFIELARQQFRSMIKCLVVFSMITAIGRITPSIVPPVLEVQNTFFNTSLYLFREERLPPVLINHAKQAIESEIIAITVRFNDRNHLPHFIHFQRTPRSGTHSLPENTVKGMPAAVLGIVIKELCTALFVSAARMAPILIPLPCLCRSCK